MNYFLLPPAYPFIYKKFEYIEKADESPEDLGSLPKYLYEIKEKIQQFDSQWDIYKEYTNPFEYIHTTVPYDKPVSKYKPLSRSYFKMVELIKQFDLLKKYENVAIKSFHLAEGPGGFIEALVNTRVLQCPESQKDDIYYGMTIIDEVDKTIPSWKKSQIFLKKNPTIILEFGKSQTGNLLDIDNFVYCVEKYTNSMDFITADGGFDFSLDFNNQEQNVLLLVLAQIVYALCMQKKGGIFILKIFDCFLKPTADLIYLLTSFYQHVFITKPQTSRFANSEKYLVCLNFHFDSIIAFYPYLYNVFSQSLKNHGTNRIRFFPSQLPRYFSVKLEEFNIILGQQQIENIYATISLMDNKQNKKGKIDLLIQNNVGKCIDWCNNHNIPF